MIMQKSIRELADMLCKNQLTAVELTSYCLQQIARGEPHLNAVAAVNPHALEEAQQLDQEMKTNGPRSMLHGIPLLLKDNIETGDGLPCTANAFVMAHFIPLQDAPLVTQLRQAGAIILGKTNLSEWAYFMSDDHMPSGYGSLNGQVVHPHNPSIDPLGSSTGSAVAVAAGYVPIAVGTETNGSLMAPAYQTGTVAFKPTFGLVPGEGIIPLALTQDTAGPMARHVEDCAVLLHYLQSPSSAPHDFLHACQRSVQGKRVAIVYLRSYEYQPDELLILEEVQRVLTAQGVHVERFDMVDNEMDNYPTLLMEFKHDLNAYLAQKRVFGAAHTLTSIIDFNKKHAERCLRYGQTILEKADTMSGDLNDPMYRQQRDTLLAEAERFEIAMQSNHWDAIISTQWMSYAPIAGNPSIVVPGNRITTTTTPRGVVFVGKRNDDANLIAIAHAYETMTRYHEFPDTTQWK